jgi:hypothetical protein
LFKLRAAVQVRTSILYYIEISIDLISCVEKTLYHFYIWYPTAYGEAFIKKYKKGYKIPI